MEQKKKQAEAETRMEGEMAKYAALKSAQANRALEAQKLEREKQKLSIAAPGMKTPLQTPRRKAFGL